MIKIVIFYLLFFSTALFAFVEGIGEKNLGIYSGPQTPIVSWQRGQSRADAEVYSSEHYFYDSYLDLELFELVRFWQYEFRYNEVCPTPLYIKNYDYIRYLFRLIAISYSYESVKLLEAKRFALSGKSGACYLDWNSLFGKCKPRGQDMKLFIQRAKIFFQQKKNKLRKLLDRSEQQQQRDELLRSIEQESDNPISIVLDYYQQHRGKKITSKNILSVLDDSCKQILSFVTQSCSEQDDFYSGEGLYFFPQMILESNAVNALQNPYAAYACVERFINDSVYKRRRYPLLEMIFPYVYLGFKQQKVGYLQGKLFLPGALKEFDNLGMKQLLYSKPKPKPKPKPVVVAKPKPVVVVKPKVQPKPRPQPKPKPVVVVKPKPKPVWEDHFYKAVKQLNYPKVKEVIVDIEGLIKDYPFSAQSIKKLAAPLSLYQRIKSLQQMKKYDKIGSKKTPVILSFLLYMISFDQHQGLFNVTSVLGNRFYVTNNFDKKHSFPVLIDLRNDESTNFRWQIKVLAEKKRGPIKK